MNETMNQAIEKGYLLDICRDFIQEVCEEAEIHYCLKQRSVKAITAGNAKRVKCIVMWQGLIVFEVSFLASTNIGYFLQMTKQQAREAFADFFQARRGNAA